MPVRSRSLMFTIMDSEKVTRFLSLFDNDYFPDITKFLRYEGFLLKLMIELEYGFLDELVSQELLDLEQVDEVTAVSTRRRRQLVDSLLERVTSSERCQQLFIEALNKTNQRHVGHFYSRTGRFPRDHEEYNCWPLDAVRKSRIKRNMRILVERLDPDHGLVREWASMGCINHQQCCDVELTSPQFKRNRKLLNILLKRSVADYDLFVECLKKERFHQSHIADLLEISDDEARTAQTSWRRELENLLELKFGLLDQLMSLGLINYEDRIEDLEDKVPFLEQRSRVLNLMVKQSTEYRQRFLKALESTNQSHVACFIERKGCRYTNFVELFKTWPLFSQLKSRITRNMCQLVELIDPVLELVNSLYSVACINTLQKCDLDDTRNQYHKARKLLDFLLQSSIANYESFIECLKLNSQGHVAPLFENDVVVERVDCTISSREPHGDVQEQEEAIVRHLKDDRSSNGPKKFDAINVVLREQVHTDVCLVDLRKGHSIRCYLLCRSPEALQSLYQKLEQGGFNITIQSIFDILLGVENSVEVVKTEGESTSTVLMRKTAIFSQDLDIGSRQEVPSSSAFSLTQFDMLPYEVIELLLLRVAVVLFKINRLRLLTERPDVMTLVTISSVCRDWFDVITGRKFNRRRLKLSFKKSRVAPTELLKVAIFLRQRLIDTPLQARDADVIVLRQLSTVCRHWWTALSESDVTQRRMKRVFRYNPQLIATFNDPPRFINGDPHRVTGVTILNEFLYVVYARHNGIEVFDCANVANRVKAIVVDEMKDPGDVVNCGQTFQLFINDWGSDVIWRVRLGSGLSEVFSRPGRSPRWTLSLDDGRLLATSRDLLLIYDTESGDVQDTVQLKEEEEMRGKAWDAIESNRNSFFVLHELRDYNSAVSEIVSEGRVIRVFNNEEHLNCFYLAVDSTGRLLIADRMNVRVIQLDEHLKLKRVLFAKQRLDNQQPWRLYYNKNNNRLAVGLNNGCVKLFQCR